MSQARLLGWRGFAAVIGPAAAIALVMALFEQSTDRIVGTVGMFAGVASVALSQYASRRSSVKRVVFLAKSRSSFARNIGRGIAEALAEYPDIKVEMMFPPAGQDGAKWQYEQLRDRNVVGADGVVIIPAAETEVVWRDLAAIMRRGTAVVCVDLKPPNVVFRELGVQPPCFVGSDFDRGGRIVGAAVADRLAADPDSRALLALGPESSWPARERSSWTVFQLAFTRHLDRCTVLALESWDRDREAERLVESLMVPNLHGRRVVVFAGNDKIAVALDRLLRKRVATPGPGAVEIIGYDGTSSEDGELSVLELEHGFATVDTLPIEQGRAAAEFIAWAYTGERPHHTKRIIPPELRACDLSEAATTA